MRNTLGYRATIGILVPARNTTVQPESEDMRPLGVTNHVARLGFKGMSRAPLSSDFKVNQYSQDYHSAIDLVRLAEPDLILLGYSHDSFIGGVRGGEALQAKLTAYAGRPVVVPSLAYRAAVRALDLKRVAILTPYVSDDDPLVRAFFEELGCVVVRIRALEFKTAHDIAQMPEAVIRDGLTAVDGRDVDAILQVGTNLPTARIAAEAEFWLRKPVLACNTVDYWHALRTAGVNDRSPAFGTLFSSH
ncbi:MAG: arylmalonate decarboxylase [Alphaproteobacteria bacterium]|nr:arylmalonate decarboxylase [Alphaproteobacteria bacterium]